MEFVVVAGGCLLVELAVIPSEESFPPFRRRPFLVAKNKFMGQSPRWAKELEWDSMPRYGDLGLVAVSQVVGFIHS
jgi:hypothetical protein